MNSSKMTQRSGRFSRRLMYLTVLAGMLMLFGACGYTFSGTGAQRLHSGQSLWVSFIGIEIDSPSAQTILRRAILEESHALRGLQPAAEDTTADLRVTGNLKSYSSRALSYSAADQVRDYTLVIDVELALFRKGEVTPLWKGTLQGRQNFPANSDLSVQRASEEAALAAASRSIAQKFVSAVEHSY